MAWDYPATNPPAAFLLLWGTNVQDAQTNRTATAAAVAPGLHTFKAAAVNSGGAATSAPVMVRVVRVTLEKAPSLEGPWTADEAIYKVWTSGTNEFLRVRIDQR